MDETQLALLQQLFARQGGMFGAQPGMGQMGQQQMPQMQPPMPQPR
jgi:hypothetical protein